MSWEKKTLDQLGSVARGKSKHRPRNDERLFGGDYPFIQTADVKESGLYLTNYSQTYNEFGLKQSKLWPAGTLCITIAANIAETAILGMDACFPDSIMGFLPFEGISDVRYVKYCFDMLQRECKQISQGTTQDNLSWEKLSTITFLVPSYDQQVKIADILFAYDDLIENNKKQIKLLEEAAQRLYKEWFVDLHFPGYENTKIIDGIPEGWKKSSLEEICELQETIISVEELALNCPYIGLEHMPRKDFCLASFGQAQDSCGKKYFFEEDDIIFAKIRPYFHKVGFAITSGVVSLDSFVIKSQKGFWGLLLMTMFSEDFVNYSYRTCKEGAKMPRADWNQMKKYYVKIPDDQIRKEFEENIWSITRQIKVLAFQNKNLLEARDRLLPKLIQGEIDL